MGLAILKVEGKTTTINKEGKMKVLGLVLSAVLVLGLVVIGNNNVYAGDEGWYAAGGVLAGLVAGAVISDAARPRYYYREPAYVRPVYCRPVRYYSPVYRYDTYRNYSYATSPYTSTTVYGHDVVHTW